MEGYANMPWRPKSAPYTTKDEEEYLVIGIDFGTTFSGAAWATGADFEKQQENVITTWPDNGHEEGKAPTEIFYEADEVSWGFGVPDDADPIRWFKLLLLKEEDIDPEVRQHEFAVLARRQMNENNKSATDFIADYLRELWRHILDNIIRTRSEGVVEALPFHIVITVPAMWKGYARQGMERAVQRAGMLEKRPAGQTILSFAPEPEAAALSTLSEPGRVVKKDDVYLICDAGGGTVDLITYRIDSLNPICLHEAVRGDGGLCGGIFIDEAFAYLCKSRLGRKWGRLSKIGLKDVMTAEWQQSIKPQFRPGDSNKEYIVRIPSEAFGKDSQDDFSREPYIKKGRIHFKSSHIQQAFTKVFGRIDELVDAQVKQASSQGLRVTGIILVGGLGGSPYLYDHLKARYNIGGSDGIEILQSRGMRPRTAICRGAVLKGFLDGANKGLEQVVPRAGSTIAVTSTIARASIGVLFNPDFDKTKHREEDKIWDDNDGIWRANDQIEWYLMRGTNVSKAAPVTKSYVQPFLTNPGKTIEVKVSYCDDEAPPTRRTSSVKTLCTIKCTLDVPFSSLRDHQRPDGKIIKKLDYDLKMIPSGASMDFEVYFGGRTLGTKNANIQFM